MGGDWLTVRAESAKRLLDFYKSVNVLAVVTLLAVIAQIVMIQRDLGIVYIRRRQRLNVMNDIPRLFAAALAHATVNQSALRDVCTAASRPCFGIVKCFREILCHNKKTVNLFLVYGYHNIEWVSVITHF